MSNLSDASLTSKPPLSGRRVFIYFLLFFLAFITVDVCMATIAIKTRTGLITDHPYEKGLEYNKLIKAADEQAELHWKGNIDYANGELSFTLRDANGKPLKVESAEAQFLRPTQSGLDFNMPMQISDENIHATPAFPAKGLWEVRVIALAQGKHFQQAKRITVP